MPLELINTSAPRGIKPGSRGFCTVAYTRGMPVNLVQLCESLSGYVHVFSMEDSRYKQNPVVYSHYRFTLGGQTYSILSRVAAYDPDYTGRTNKLAHHLVFSDDETKRMPGGPAWAMLQHGFFVESWSGEPRYLEPNRVVPSREQPGSYRAETWQHLMGDAGFAGDLAQAWLDNPDLPAFLRFQPDKSEGLLQLIAEAQVLLPPSQQWECSFNTYFTVLPSGTTCNWRCCLPDADVWKIARRNPGCLVFDLASGTHESGKQPADTTLRECAIQGKCPEQATAQANEPHDELEPGHVFLHDESAEDAAELQSDVRAGAIRCKVASRASPRVQEHVGTYSNEPRPKTSARNLLPKIVFLAVVLAGCLTVRYVVLNKKTTLAGLTKKEQIASPKKGQAAAFHSTSEKTSDSSLPRLSEPLSPEQESASKEEPTLPVASPPAAETTDTETPENSFFGQKEPEEKQEQLPEKHEEQAVVEAKKIELKVWDWAEFKAEKMALLYPGNTNIFELGSDGKRQDNMNVRSTKSISEKTSLELTNTENRISIPVKLDDRSISSLLLVVEDEALHLIMGKNTHILDADCSFVLDARQGYVAAKIPVFQYKNKDLNQALNEKLAMSLKVDNTNLVVRSCKKSPDEQEFDVILDLRGKGLLDVGESDSNKKTLEDLESQQAELRDRSSVVTSILILSGQATSQQKRDAVEKLGRFLVNSRQFSSNTNFQGAVKKTSDKDKEDVVLTLAKITFISNTEGKHFKDVKKELSADQTISGLGLIEYLNNAWKKSSFDKDLIKKIHNAGKNLEKHNTLFDGFAKNMEAQVSELDEKMKKLQEAIEADDKKRAGYFSSITNKPLIMSLSDGVTIQLSPKR